MENAAEKDRQNLTNGIRQETKDTNSVANSASNSVSHQLLQF